MEVLKKLVAAVGLSLLIIGCSSKAEKPKIPDKPASELYAEAQSAMNTQNFITAAETLEALDTRFPFGPYSTQVQLDLIYVYYKQKLTAKGLANADRFIRNNPTHPELDYVYYMRGLTNMAADHNFFQSLMRIDRFDRDPSYARGAFRDFNTLLTRYPNSQYASDAQRRMFFLKSNLARYELTVAEYYLKREAYIGSANRARYVIENFPDTKAAREALDVMASAYEKLGLDDLQQQALAVRDAN